MLKEWVNRNYLKKRGTPEYHIYDSGNVTAHIGDRNRINNQGDGSSAGMTQKRKKEHCIHSDIVQKLFDAQLDINDIMDVSTEISALIRATNPKGFNPETMKKKLNKYGA